MEYSFHFKRSWTILSVCIHMREKKNTEYFSRLPNKAIYPFTFFLSIKNLSTSHVNEQDI